MALQLSIFETEKSVRNKLRNRSGQFCTMTQKEADERYHKVASVMTENAMLRRKVESLTDLVSIYSRKLKSL